MAADRIDRIPVSNQAQPDSVGASEGKNDELAVAVFAPALLLMIEIHRNADASNDVHLHAGGQGYWVSRMIRALGVRSIPCSPIGGEPGNALREIAACDGLDARLTPMARPNAVIIEDRCDGHHTTMVETGFPQ